mgnify:CR=1 FL=1
MALIRLAILALLLSGATFADDRRAEVNYMLHCQGCHLPKAEGMDGRVPPLKDFVGNFLHSREGRDFLIRVPGVAHSALSNEEVAELMNWLLESFSAGQLPDPFIPYTQEEVEALRSDPERNPGAARLRILSALAMKLPDVAATLGRDSPSRR